MFHSLITSSGTNHIKTADRNLNFNECKHFYPVKELKLALKVLCIADSC